MSDNTLSDGEKQAAVAAMVVALATEYVKNQPLKVDEIPAVFAAFKTEIMSLWGITLEEPAPAPVEDPVQKPTPSQIKKSVTPDHLISFLDGKPYKTLGRHLKANGITPKEYRERFGLPVDYPMVASSYSEQRSQLARSQGLGSHRRAA